MQILIETPAIIILTVVVWVLVWNVYTVYLFQLFAIILGFVIITNCKIQNLTNISVN